MRLWNALRLVLLVQRRSRFLHIYLGVAVLTVLVIRLLIPEHLNGRVVPAVLLGEPGTLGILLVAAYAYLERNEVRTRRFPSVRAGLSAAKGRSRPDAMDPQPDLEREEQVDPIAEVSAHAGAAVAKEVPEALAQQD